MARNLNVQTPGEAPKAPETEELNAPGSGDPAEGTGQQTAEASADMDALRSRIAELEAEVAAKSKETEDAKKRLADDDKAFDRASESISRHDREKFRNMRADQVDPKKLVAAVLTKDGWVAPDQSGQKAKE